MFPSAPRNTHAKTAKKFLEIIHVYFIATKLCYSLYCWYKHVLASTSTVKMSGVELAVVLLKAIQRVHVWHELKMKYFVLFEERLHITSCKILQAGLKWNYQNSAYSRTWASRHCIQNIVFAKPSSSTMCNYCGKEPGCRKNIREYSEIFLCGALRLAQYYITDIVLQHLWYLR